MEMSFKRLRKVRFSESETTLLLQKIEENTNVIHWGNSNMKRIEWDSIARAISAVSGTHRKTHEVKKRWSDMKTAVNGYLRGKRKNPMVPTKRPPYMARILSIMKTALKRDDQLVTQQLVEDHKKCEDIVQENGGSFQILQVESLATGATRHVILDTTCHIPENSPEVIADTSHILENNHQVTADTHEILKNSPQLTTTDTECIHADSLHMTADADHILENGFQVTADISNIPDNSLQVTADTHHSLENSPEGAAGTSLIPENSHQITADIHHILKNNHQGTTDTSGTSGNSQQTANHEVKASIASNVPQKNHQITSDICQIPLRKKNLSAGGIPRGRPRRPIHASAADIPEMSGHFPSGMACTGDLPQVFDASNASTVILKMRERTRENIHDEMWDRWFESEISVNEKRKECMDAYLEVMELKKRKLELDIKFAQSNR